MLLMHTQTTEASTFMHTSRTGSLPLLQQCLSRVDTIPNYVSTNLSKLGSVAFPVFAKQMQHF